MSHEPPCSTASQQSPQSQALLPLRPVLLGADRGWATAGLLVSLCLVRDSDWLRPPWDPAAVPRLAESPANCRSSSAFACFSFLFLSFSFFLFFSFSFLLWSSSSSSSFFFFYLCWCLLVLLWMESSAKDAGLQAFYGTKHTAN